MVPGGGKKPVGKKLKGDRFWSEREEHSYAEIQKAAFLGGGPASLEVFKRNVASPSLRW